MNRERDWRAWFDSRSYAVRGALLGLAYGTLVTMVARLGAIGEWLAQSLGFVFLPLKIFYAITDLPNRFPGSLDELNLIHLGLRLLSVALFGAVVGSAVHAFRRSRTRSWVKGVLCGTIAGALLPLWMFDFDTWLKAATFSETGMFGGIGTMMVYGIFITSVLLGGVVGAAVEKKVAVE